MCRALVLLSGCLNPMNEASAGRRISLGRPWSALGILSYYYDQRASVRAHPSHDRRPTRVRKLTKTGTLNAEAVAQWAPALPVSVNVELFNMDRSLLNYTYRLASRVTPGASSRTFIAGFP